MAIFNRLKASLAEAVEIKKGVQTAAVVTRYDIADIKTIREQRNVSQNEMAKALDINPDTIKKRS